MKHLKILISFLLFLVLFSSQVTAEAREERLFSTLEGKKQFAAEVSVLIEKAWKKWQDSILINNVDVEGSQGLLFPGDLGKPVLTASSILEDFDRKGKQQGYIDCVKTVASAVANAVRLWQRGYQNTDIPFPQGASCTFTLPPSNNIPVTVALGQSSGDKEMTESALYSYMLYRAPKDDKDIKEVFRSSAKAIAECFVQWKNSCSIIGILATGGIAPHPAPMGTGPGPVRGAKGQNGKLVGSYFDGSLMYNKMVEYFKSRQEKG